jgi:hypothetical protein
VRQPCGDSREGHGTRRRNRRGHPGSETVEHGQECPDLKEIEYQSARRFTKLDDGSGHDRQEDRMLWYNAAVLRPGDLMCVSAPVQLIRKIQVTIPYESQCGQIAAIAITAKVGDAS